MGGELAARSSRAILATDDWPFLYLENRSIPDAIVVVGAMFLLGVWVVLRRTKLIAWKRTPYFWHFFFLGAGFLLLETRAITSLSLLFGSTWVVNAVVIASFLLLSMLSNMVAGVWNVPPAAGYGALLLLLVGAVLFPLSPAGNTNSWIWSILASFWVALPAFFAGLVFSTGFKRVNFPAQVLGINLFGAVCGGLLENAVMVGGTRSLELARNVPLYVLCDLSSAFAVQGGRRLDGLTRPRSLFGTTILVPSIDVTAAMGGTAPAVPLQYSCEYEHPFVKGQSGLSPVLRTRLRALETVDQSRDIPRPRKPLSIFTTLTFDAQEFIIPSRAATPSKAAP